MSDEQHKSLGESVDRATEACMYCPKLCRFTCPVAQVEARETVTPWGLMRLLEMARRGDVALDEEVAEVFHHCTGCGRCQTWCLHDNDVASAMVAARGWSYEAGVTAPVVREALAKATEQGAPLAYERFDEDELDAVFDPIGRVAYVPDCRTVSERPELVLRTGALLRQLLGERVRLVSASADDGPGCCGAWWAEAGDVASAEGCGAAMDDAIAGSRQVIVECPGMLTRWRARGVLVDHVLEVVARRGRAERPSMLLDGQGALLFEDCQLGRRGGLGEVMREVAAMIFEEPPQGFASGGAQSPCCGGGGTYPWVAPEESLECAREVFAQAAREGADRVVCGAAGCQRQLNAAGEEDAALDLLEAVCLAYGL
jgi:Fe-S oxidoreductase